MGAAPAASPVVPVLRRCARVVAPDAAPKGFVHSLLPRAEGRRAQAFRRRPHLRALQAHACWPAGKDKRERSRALTLNSR